MVVDQIDIEGVSILDPEDDAPVAGYAHGPEAMEVAGQRVQHLARQVHVARSRGGLQGGQDALDLVEQPRIDPADISPSCRRSRPRCRIDLIIPYA